MRHNTWMGLSLAVFTAACAGRDVQDTFTKCVVRAEDTNWELAKMDVDVTSPNVCPWKIPNGLTTPQNFTGVVTGDYHYIGSNGYVNFDQNSVVFVRVYNSRNPPVLVNDFQVVPQYIFNGMPPRSDAHVGYAAGTYTPVFDDHGQDWGYLDVSFIQKGTGTRGRAKLSYTYALTSAIIGPVSVIGGSMINLSTTVSNYRSPVTYRWWKNGSLMTGVTWSAFSTNGPATGTSNTYKVEMTDADGDKGTDTHVVSGGTASPPPGGGGGGCLKAPGPGTDQVACPPP